MRTKPSRKKRRTAADIFIEKLSSLAKGEQTLVMNATLREALKWDEEKYNDIRLQLKKDGRIFVGTGQGGKVGLAQSANSKALKLFISYSHIDEKLQKEFRKHIEPLVRLKLVEYFFDGNIKAGNDLDHAILKELDSSDIVVLLVNIDYLNSYYCVEIEIEKAMERHRGNECRVVPIILRSCMWQHMPFSKLKALPLDAKAVSKWDDLDEAMVTIAEGIRLVAEELLSAR